VGHIANRGNQEKLTKSGNFMMNPMFCESRER